MDGPLVPNAPQPGQVALRWLGQGGFAFRSPNGVVWCVDPQLFLDALQAQAIPAQPRLLAIGETLVVGR